MFLRRKVLQFDCTSSTLSHLEIPRKNILVSFPVLPSTPPKHKPLKSRSYCLVSIKNCQCYLPKNFKKTVRGQKTNRRVLKITRLNVLDPVPVLGWICCAYHQSTQYRKPCLNVEGSMNFWKKRGKTEDGNEPGAASYMHEPRKTQPSWVSFKAYNLKPVCWSCAIFFIV